jgi:hypothetical protein
MFSQTYAQIILDTPTHIYILCYVVLLYITNIYI